jgi:hypothetical protein
MQFAPHSGGSKAPVVEIDGKSYAELIDHHPQKQIKMDYFNKQGWGFADSGFTYVKEQNMAKIKGTRYMHGNEFLPGFLAYFESVLEIDPRYSDPS